MVPIRANPLEFNYAGDDDELDEDNHIMFELKVKVSVILLLYGHADHRHQSG